MIWLDPNPPPLHEQAVEPSKPTYTQPDWGAYDRGQQLEHEVFDRYLRILVAGSTRRPGPAQSVAGRLSRCAPK